MLFYIRDTAFLLNTLLNRTVHKYNQLMKDFPLNELLAATDLDKIQEAVVFIFGHLNKKLKLSPYPVRRALPLVEAISRDLNDQLLRVLSSLRLMYLDYEPFERAMKSANNVFQAWDESIKEFTNVARDVTRKRSEKFIPIKISAAHAKLQSRVLYLRQFRKSHDQLRHMISPTKGLITSMLQPGQQQITDGSISQEESAINRRAARGLTDFDMEEEVRLAYETVKTVDVLDISAGAWSLTRSMSNANDRPIFQMAQRSGWLQKPLTTSESPGLKTRSLAVFASSSMLLKLPVPCSACLVASMLSLSDLKSEELFKNGKRNSLIP